MNNNFFNSVQKFLFGILICLIIGLPNLHAQNFSFTVGEKLTYNISYSTNTDAGYAELHSVSREKYNQREAILINAKVRTSGIVSAALFSFNNEYSTLVDEKNGLPLKTVRIVREDFKNTEFTKEFPENLTAGQESGNFDYVSAIYHLRALPLQIGDVYTFNVNEDEKVMALEARVIKREIITTSSGAFDSLVVQCYSRTDESLKRLRIQLQFSNDDRRLPLSIKVNLGKGDIIATLASVQNTQPQIVPTPKPTPTPTPVPVVPRPTPQPVKPYKDNEPLAPDLPFALGENLRFDMKFNNQNLGTAVLNVGERKLFFGKDSVLLSATVENKTGNQNFFLPTDVLKSYVAPNYLIPLRSESVLGGDLAGFSQNLQFDQSRGTVLSSRAAQIDIPVGTHDLVSFAFALRAFNFQIPNPKNRSETPNVRVSVFINDKPYILSLTATGLENLEINGKKMQTLAIVITNDQPPINQFNIKLWLTLDNRRLPLRLLVSSPYGLIQADLKSQLVNN
jgi:hypothetical protein